MPLQPAKASGRWERRRSAPNVDAMWCKLPCLSKMVW